ncbi:hypothetical protein ACPXB3_14875 [Gordonia sp. DT219]|uniref:hypothetical protein n=1 Tax=Gordonia sp. DT219 TaxID=3416658 RepID=UPI003CFABFF6
MSIATRTKGATGHVTATDGGEFDIVLSAQSKDRDGDVLTKDGWKQPLPQHIPIGVDHSMSVDGIVGSGRPFIDDAGNLRVRGTFAPTELGQRVRQLVTTGHLQTVSVEFLEDGTKSGTTPQRELIGGAFVYLPSNRDARVLSSKGAPPDPAAVPPDPTTAADPTGQPANTLDPEAVADLIAGAQALTTLPDDQVPDQLAALGQVLDLLGQSYPPDPGTAPDGSPDGSPDDAAKSAAVSARVKALLLALE